jgi:hypothetical protein
MVWHDIMSSYAGSSRDMPNASRQLEKLAVTIWDAVCLNIDKVLKECELHGLAGILSVPDPSVESRLNALRTFEEVCTAIIGALEDSSDGHSTIRTMINAQQQIWNLRLLLNAAKSGDEAEFKEVQARLGNQATH